uniref:F-box associated domain-containing protein n=1 Tax=Arundo donax TaxID=35708 RepID=A0A0A9DGB9_ARUDO
MSSFRVVRYDRDTRQGVLRVHVNVFSSDTLEWSIPTWVDYSANPGHKNLWSNMQGNQLIHYWVSGNPHLVTLDRATMEFSVAKLPHILMDEDCDFKVGEVNNGTPCLVYAIDFSIGVFLRCTDGDGVERWVLDRAIPSDTDAGRILLELKRMYNELLVLAVRDGFAYLVALDNSDSPLITSLFLSLCLETMELEKLFQNPFAYHAVPYVMAWPPLIGNYGRFAHEQINMP